MAYALEMNHERLRLDTGAFTAWLALQTGAEAEAQQWVASSNPNAPLVPLTTFHVADLTRAKILLARGRSVDLAHAAQVLTSLHDLATTIHSPRHLIEVLALQALIHESRGQRDAAPGTLKQALQLAEPTGIIRRLRRPRAETGHPTPSACFAGCGAHVSPQDPGRDQPGTRATFCAEAGTSGSARRGRRRAHRAADGA